MGSTKSKLIQLFKEQEDYLSGQRLAERLNVSRTAVWKNIKELEKEGFVFESLKWKGYKLLESPVSISPSEVQQSLDTIELGKKLFYFKEVTSTQERVHALAKEGYPHGTVVLAGEQTAGKGRRKREWSSLKGKGMWMSLLLRPPFPPAKAPQLTLVAATTVVQVLREFGVTAKIKWPNDIMIGDRKVCGILTEMQAEQDWIDYLVLGIGLNVNQNETEMPGELKKKATSLYIETGVESAIEDIVSCLLNRFEVELGRFYDKGFLPFQQEWQSSGYKTGEWVDVSTWKKPWRAKVTRIEEDGALTVLDEQGQEQRLYSAEILWNDHYYG
ncbi:biotin--[acetyl-CoA-carboxylase] ligase [Salimicrobium halophilum]|uniref:Bifunctional ligase/repressor BirA n=1 Tax=Salimicrobium halophilum TaxID=86666 RepID=A0A1G8Q1M8_9BACI|nr:biotin--[acetyl-CoA-carboxylase] ligase [Salimicrobium halophilum]SDI98632.1 BirA family transcriptional regulator, biotin operon repressor / biotin-[acetyl-CoA-carboxylase] ligase [Salimicrobium halophilum]